MIDRPKRGFMQFQDVRSFLDSVLSEDIHAKRVDSLANAALGVMTGASLAVAMIGRSLAQARGLLTKHAVKQVDRLLSNPGIEAWDIFATWVPEMVGSRTDIVVAMDWTDYDADGQATLALKLMTRDGRARKLRDAAVTEAQCPVGAAVCVHAKAMKEPWCLVASDAVASSRQIIDLYAKRWNVEPSFRDTKDLRFGMGLSAVRIGDSQRRDRLLLLNAFAIVLLTLLGAAGESLGMDRHLKSNTVKTRSHSLFRQGSMLYDLIPNMPEHRLRPLIDRFAELLQQSRAFTETFAIL